MFPCTVCNKVYSYSDALARHVKTHINISLSCEHCPQLFTRKDNLARHIKQKHTTTQIEIAQNIFISNMAAGPSNNVQGEEVWGDDVENELLLNVDEQDKILY